MSIYNLNEAELTDAYRVCVNWVRDRLKLPNVTYAALAAEINIGESALKQFIRRHQINSGHIVRRGAAFDKIYNYINDYKSVNVDNDLSDRLLTDYEKYKVYSVILKMVKSSRDEISTAASKVFEKGRFICIRNASNPQFAVISSIVFRKLGVVGDNVWEFSHYYVDNDGSDKKSDGFVLAKHKTIYLFGDIQNGEGIDILTLREPLGDAKFIVGFINSVDDNYAPFVGNVVIVPEGSIHVGEIAGEANEVEIGIFKKKTLNNFQMVDYVDFGKKLIRQLNIEYCDALLRIKKRYMIPGVAFDDDDPDYDAMGS